jgi:hypothetical protein
MTDPLAAPRAAMATHQTLLSTAMDAAQKSIDAAQQAVVAVREAATAVLQASDSGAEVQKALDAVVIPEPPPPTIPPPPNANYLVADGSGYADATADFQAACDKGGIWYVPPGLYLIDPAKSVQLRDGLVLILHPAAILVAKPNDLPRAYVLWGNGVKNVTIIGGKIHGDRLTHTYKVFSTATRKSSLDTHEWNHGVMLQQCQNVVVRDLEVYECAGDGLSISGQNITVQGVKSHHNRRQALTIGGGRGYRIVECELTDTGAMATASGPNPGTAPMAGIDMEPDAKNIEDVVIERCKIQRNATTGVLGWTRAGTGASVLGVTIRDNTLDGNANNIQAKGLDGPVEFTIVGNSLTNDRNTGVNIRLESGSKAVIGGDGDAANTFAQLKARAVSDQVGIKTSADVLLVAPTKAGQPAAIASVLLNHYR